MALAAGEQYSYFLLWLVATSGNSLGAIPNWLMGRGLNHLGEKRLTPRQQARYDKAQAWYQRFGKATLLLAWTPVFGDIITIIAGVMRLHFVPFLLLVILSKGLRYAFVLGFMAII